MGRGIDMSIVFKITSLDALKNLCNALEQTVTFQAKIQLEDELKRLAKKKAELKIDIEALRMEKHGLMPPSELEKTDAAKEIEDEAVPLAASSTLQDESATLIEELTEEPIEVEEENVEGNTDLPL